MLVETRSNLLGVTVNPRNRELSCGGRSGGEGSLVTLKGTDGGKDVQVALDLSGEPKQPDVYIRSKEIELRVYENWQLNLARIAYATRYLEKCNKTCQRASTGHLVDGIISAVLALPT
ncbi:unnamed protein product [Rotaria sp. Silwood2]|nr:unnamed protein product [Rotaria sp. Silwood2]CAF3017066.1 unnamed protein product [Rotaria sp. Silwood2]CAF3476726.1 unnamed protein product [Rotaria sp. Silwood2]CAF4107410.1 unnamed protein product [Rotaria sp. Silwood2]CAF4153638.1 unnamed protein product [Rotaria sp. Silwood2]